MSHPLKGVINLYDSNDEIESVGSDIEEEELRNRKTFMMAVIILSLEIVRTATSSAILQLTLAGRLME
jgi:hypothetical protein